MARSGAITVRLLGGLGNQLFGYFAGAALAAHRGVPLRLDTSWTRHGLTDHGIEILRFDLPGDWTAEEGPWTNLVGPGTLPARVLGTFLREIPALRRALHVHEAPGVGDDPALFQQPPGTRLRGYFQSWSIVDRAVRSGYPRRPMLKRSSPWLVDVIARAEQLRPIIVHVRRGDYAHVPEFGLLGPAYYERAIDLVRSRGLAGPLWLFSDEPQVARQALGRYAGEAEIIQSPEGPATELLAMSHGGGHVIANSTFSWWGAWMNEPGTPVVAPDPWFLDGPRVEGLIPPSWTVLRNS